MKKVAGSRGILVVLLGILTVIALNAAAQVTPPVTGATFDFPESADFSVGYDSDSALLLLPEPNTQFAVFDTIPFSDITFDTLIGAIWHTVGNFPIYPQDIIILRTVDGNTYKFTYTVPAGSSVAPVSIHYAPVPQSPGTSLPPTSVILPFYAALDLESGETFTDFTVVSVLFCDAGAIEPTPTPTTGVVPEPGSAILFILGLLGVLGAGLLARKKGRKGLWLLLLACGISLLVVGSVEYLSAQQRCTLLIEKQGTGNGYVGGDGIDCGFAQGANLCSVSASDGLVRHVKATPDANSSFVGWLVNGQPYQGLFQMTGDTVLTAIFERLPNRAPVAADDAYPTGEDTALVIATPGLLANDSDPDGDALSAMLITNPTHGDLTLNADGSFGYMPDPDYTGSDTFTYRASDADLESADATVTITVTPVNDAPTAINDAYTTDEDVPLHISAPGLLANDSDPDNDTLNAALVNAPSHGTLTLNPDGSFDYSPDADFAGIDQFIYRATDGELDSAVAAVTITVNAVDEAPVADDLTVTTVINNPANILLQGHDGDGDDLTYQIVEAPANGTLSGVDNQFTYTPNTDSQEQDTFTYLVNDGVNDSNIATVTITMLDVDLAIGGLDVSQTVFDPHTMALTGTVDVTIDNAGTVDILDAYIVQVYVEDTADGTQHTLGSLLLTGSIASGDALVVSVPIDGSLVFKDQSIYAFVDSENVIAETDEGNNITHNLVECDGMASYSFHDFASPTGLIFNGSVAPATTIDGIILRLTPSQQNQAGSVFSSEMITTSHFSTSFQFRITNPWGGGADGIVFVVQPVSSNIGGAGGGIGYSGIPNSIGVEFDNWYNYNVNDPNSNHIGIVSNGDIDHGPGAPYTVAPDALLEDGKRWYAWIDYDGAVLEVRANQTGVRPYTPLLSQTINIQSIIGGDDAYIGFTSGTGAASANHDILSWEYRGSVVPISSCEDYSASYIRVDASDFPNSATIMARIGNSGIVDSAFPLNVAFYHGDPANGGTLLGTTTTQNALASGEYEDVSFTWDTLTYGLHELYVVVDDDGTGQGSIRESNEANNTVFSIFEKPDYDLEVSQIEVSQTVFDPTTMQLSGTVDVTITNLGTYAVNSAYTVQIYVEDTANGTQHTLGSLPVSDSFAPGDTQVVSVPVNGFLMFKDQPIHVFVDSENVIAETNEGNNIAHNLVDCQMPPAAPGSFHPVLEWEWTDSQTLPEYNQVMTMPIVIQVTDDNGNGIIDEQDVPDIVFSTYSSSTGQYRQDGVLRAISGDDGEEIWTVTDPALRVFPIGNNAAGDIDGDGFPEIVCFGAHGSMQERYILAFEHDGTLKWKTSTPITMAWYNSNFTASISLADINHDRNPEILAINHLLDREGNILWSGQAGDGNGMPHAVDLDLNGDMEIIAGLTAYRSDGSIYWNLGYDGFSAIANFDNDPFPEIIVIRYNTVYLIEHNGNIIWQKGLPSGVFTYPIIADIDNDSKPEIGVAGPDRYIALETDGNVKWSAPINELFEGSGSTAFDFEGDGATEVIYSDQTHIRVFRGNDGTLLFSQPSNSGTVSEYAVIADVDNDHNAELVVPSDNYYYGGTTHGILVFGDANDSWVNTRKIWNQHSYHITNVNDDGTIPQFEANSWQEHNTYRCNLSPDALACEDYSASYVRVDASDFPNSATIMARIGNSGIVDSAFPLNVAFYHGDPANGGMLLGTTTTQNALLSAEYEDVSFIWDTPPSGLQDVYVVVDDDGTGTGSIRESDETNNVASFSVFLNAPPEIVSTPIVTFTVPTNIPDAPAPDENVIPSDAYKAELYSPLSQQLSFEATGFHPGSASGELYAISREAIDGLADHNVMLVRSDGSDIVLSQPSQYPTNGGTSHQGRYGADFILDPNDPGQWAYIVDGGTFCVGSAPCSGTYSGYQNGRIFRVNLQTGAIDVIVDSGLLIEPLSISYNPVDELFYIADRGKLDEAGDGTLYTFDGSSVTPVLENIDPISVICRSNGSIVYSSDSMANDPGLFLFDGNVTTKIFDTFGNLAYSPGRQFAPTLFLSTEGQILELRDITGDGIIDETVTIVEQGAGKIKFDLEGNLYTLYSSNHTAQDTLYKITPLVIDTYRYDVNAIDHDGDTLTYSLLTGSDGMTIDSETGFISWKPMLEDEGDHEVEILVDDGNGGSDMQAYVLHVGVDNHLPVILTEPVKSAIIPETATQTTYTYSVDAFDADGDVLTYQLFAAPNDMVIDADTGRIVWEPAVDQVGEHLVTVVVDDGQGGTDEQSFLVGVAEEIDNFPIITSTPPIVVVQDEVYSYAVEAVDSDGDTLTFSLSTSPDAMSIDPATGASTWNPGSDDLGQHSITIRVTDGRGGFDEQDYTLYVVEVNLPPQIISTPVTNGIAGMEYTYAVEVVDSLYDRLTYTLQNAPDGMSVDAASGFITWTPAYSQLGNYPLSIEVTDLLGASDVQNFTLTIDSQGVIPEVHLIAPVDGTTISADDTVDIVAEATDEDGVITKVEFYAGTRLFGEADTAPYKAPWTIITPGMHTVTARAYDNNGAWAISTPIHIIVPNRQPEITSEPPVTVQDTNTFTYDVDAIDPDNDTLTFSLDTAPTGMSIDLATGLITWTPTTAQVGSHAVKVIVEDGNGAGASQSWTLHVTQPQTGNLFAPQITSIPPQIVILGDTYSYDVEATDGDGDPLNYTLSTAPAGTTIDTATGLIAWTPTEADLGIQQFTVLVDDGRGGLAGQYFEILVREPNQAPTVKIGYPIDNQQITIGDTVPIQAQATDADGTITKVEFFVDGLLLGDDTTAPFDISWTPTIEGNVTLTAVATDNEGDTATSNPLTVQIVPVPPDTEAPEIAISVSPNPAQLGETVTITLTITDASPITASTVMVNGTAVPLTGNVGTYVTTATGFFTVEATATDGAGNAGSSTGTFSVTDGSDTTPPSVDLRDDVELQCVELAADLYDIIGSVTDDSNDVRYTLQAKQKGCGAWETLAEGSGAVADAALTTFDPTIHRNGVYEVRLQAEDAGGNTTEVSGCVLVDGRFKAGQSSIGGIDFNIPQMGYPLLAGRVYDSRNTCEGGFGEGWGMPNEPSNVQAEFTYNPSENWGEDARGNFFTTYYLISRDRKVLVLRIGEGVFKFRMDVNPKSSFMRPIMDNYTPLYVDYIPVDGTKGSLEALNVEAENFLFGGGILADYEGNNYNPTRFKLTLDDGSIYIFDKYEGLLSMTDPYGHSIAYSDDAITHSSGASLSIERDTSNRIESIKDYLGRTVEYRYDENGMLEQVVQLGEGPYPMRVLEAYAYQKGLFERPVLKDIIAPDGTRLGAFEYDSSGRKTGLLDHKGNRVLFGYDAAQHEYTVTDRRGNPTTYVYDADGNVISITDAEDNTTSYTYDTDGHVLSETNTRGYTTSKTYDDDGNVLTETDPLGNRVSYTYDADGNRLTATDPLGHTTEFTYDAYGQVLTTTDALDNVTRMAYNDDGLMTSMTDALNNTTRYSYDAQGNMTQKTDPLGHSVEFTYDLYGNVTASTDEMGNVTHKEYDPQGNNTKITDALGYVTTMDYHHTGKVTEYVDPAGQKNVNDFDSNGNLLSNTDAAGNTFFFEYDENEQPTVTTSTITTENGVETVTIEKVYDDLNRVTEQIDADGLSTEAEYDALGRQTATTDKLGNRSEIQYDPRNLPLKSIGPDGSTETNVYDAAGRLAQKTDTRGNTAAYTYDAVGNVVRTENQADGTWVENDYDALGRMIGTTSSTGLSTSRIYDEAGRLTSETDALGRTTSYTYYADGKRQTMTDPRGNVFEFEYDAKGQQTAMIFPDGSRVTYVYNDQGKKVSETNQLGQTQYFDWNDLGLLKSITDPLGHTTSYAYNEIGNLVSQTDANQHTTTFAYNKLGRRIGKTYPLGMSQSISYDVANRTTSVTDFNGETITSHYDQQGRLTQTDLPDGSAITYTYTGTGEIASVTTIAGTTSYTYDTDGRLTSVTDANGQTVSYTYDTLGRKQSVTVPSGTTTYGYDGYGRLDTVQSPDGTTTYTYDAHGNKASVVYPNGIATTYGYDTLNRLTSVETRNLTNDLLASYAYTLNSKGQRTRVEEGAGGPTVRVIEYEYDAADRLIAERITDPVLGNRAITYSYDPVGNRLEKNDNGAITAYTYDNNDRLLTEGGYAYTYDNNGNMLTKSGNGENWQVSYNALNQVTGADITTPSGGTSVTYQYDHDGIRLAKTVNGTDVTRYLVDKNRPYAQVLEEQRSVSGFDATTSYVYGDDLLSQSTAGISHYYVYDGLGSARGLTDSAGTLTDAYRYDAYGNWLDKSGDTRNMYGYRGEQYDEALDAYYLRARYYQPGIGRFVSTDPVEGMFGDPLSAHRYLYGYSDPVNNLDPSGEVTLNEVLVSGAIVLNLSGIALSLTDVGSEFYALMGEKWFPDAYTIGIYGYISQRELAFIAHLMPVALDIVHYGQEETAGIALEALLSVSSAQVAAFIVPGLSSEGSVMGAMNDHSKRNWSYTIYQGYVWNLWNAANYSGNFLSFSIANYSIFFAPETGLSGPWGLGRTLFSKSSTKWRDKAMSFSSMVTYYYPFGSPQNYESEFFVGGMALAYSMLGNLIRKVGNPTSDDWKYWMGIDITMWTQTMLAKYHWNKHSGYTTTRRQEDPRPPDFQSGPGYLVLNRFF